MPVFSHWQGRLDPRVMILGSMRGTGNIEVGSVRVQDPGHQGNTLQRGITLQRVLRAPGTEIGKNMVYFLDYFALPSNIQM